MDECEEKDFLDKKSTHYFMCHMTDEEFSEIRGNGSPMEFAFNRIQPERSKREDPMKTHLNPGKGLESLQEGWDLIGMRCSEQSGN